MTTTIEPQLLVQLHRILKQQTDLTGRIRRCPIRIQAVREQVAVLEAEIAGQRETLQQTRMAADQKQLQLNQREARIEDLKGKRNSCDNNREYQVFTEQIAADQQANSCQADEILESLERVDRIETEIAAAESRLATGQQKLAAVKSNVETELAGLNSDLSCVQTELQEAESRLPADVLGPYRRVVESVGEDAIAEVENGSCGHCNTTQTTQVVSDLMLHHAVFCKSCGSLMYLVQEAAV